MSLRDADRALMVMSWFYHELTDETETGTLLKDRNTQVCKIYLDDLES